ncbi:MAG: FIST N-terminal domain-containing protein [Pseudomonadota bacterium]
MRVGTGLSEAHETLVAVEEALAAARLAAGGTAPEGVLLWLTPHHAEALPAVLERLKAEGGPRHLAGCLAPGVICGDRELFDTPGVAVMSFHEAEPWRLSTMIVRGLSERNEQAAQALVAALQPGDLGLVMLSTSGFSPESFERGLRTPRTGLAVLGGGAVNLGGPDWVFTGWGPHDDAMAVFIVRACRPACAVSQSCRAVSRPYRVGGARGRVVAALGGKPAARALMRVVKQIGIAEAEIGRHLMVGLTQASDLAAIARGDTCVRPVLGVEDRIGALYLGAEVREGDWLTFLLRDQDHARMDLNAAALELAGQIAHRGAPEYSLLVDCSGRGPAFQGIPEHDAAILAAHLGSVPLAGFFSGFELAPRPTSPASVHLFAAVAAVGWGI